MMKSLFAYIGCLFAVAVMAACSMQQLSNNTATIAQLCSAAIPIVNANVPSAQDLTSADGIVMAYAKASCNADGTVSAALAVNTTPQTPSWLQDTLNAAAIVARVAPIVLGVV